MARDHETALPDEGPRRRLTLRDQIDCDAGL
jgi:hypothetical protein